MKSVSLLLAIAAVAGLASCSNDDHDTLTPTKNEVRFNVTVPISTRALTTTAKLDHFRIFSFVDSQPYMSNVQADKTGSNWATTPVMYWPADDKPVNFYCISPMVGTETDSGESLPHIKDYVNTDGTTDLLYAVNIGAVINPVRINFRHALSRIAFNFKRRQASSSQAPIKVEVKDVAVTNIFSKGSFNYPNQTTAPSGMAVGTWLDQSAATDAQIFSGSVKTLTDAYTTINSTGYEFALPQELPVSKEDMSGAYLRVLCSVYDETSGVRIWPKSQAEDYLYFPLNSPGAANTTKTWEPGKAYAYNITIGVPEGTGKIEFDITVDDYPDFADMPVE